MVHFTIESLSEWCDIFWLYHKHFGNNIPEISEISNLNKAIEAKIKKNDIFTIITYSPKPKNNKSDDWVYENYPEMKKYLPRAMSLIFLDSEFGILGSYQECVRSTFLVTWISVWIDTQQPNAKGWVQLQKQH